MNERIQELMKEAQVIYDYAPFYGDMDRDPKPLYKLDPEKFAELIVRECVDSIVRDTANYQGEGMMAYYQGVQDAGKSIKKHFGVE